MTYSPVLATAIWNGNHDGRVLTSDTHDICFKISANYIDRVHEEVYGADGKWKSGDKINEPAGMQHMAVNGKADIWPSWYNKSKSSGISTEKMTFDSVSKKLATDCTPASTRVEVEVSKIIDPMTQKESITAEGYDAEAEDDVHTCSDAKPSVGTISVSGNEIAVPINHITGRTTRYVITVNGKAAREGDIVSSGTVHYTASEEPTSISVTLKDSLGYTASGSWTKPKTTPKENTETDADKKE